MQPADRKTGEADELLGVVFSLEEVREIREETLRIGGTHLAEVRRATLSPTPSCVADSFSYIELGPVEDLA